jgi:hypothetical protein
VICVPQRGNGGAQCAQAVGDTVTATMPATGMHLQAVARVKGELFQRWQAADSVWQHRQVGTVDEQHLTSLARVCVRA